jgi:peptide/nickel transport system permease protein
MTVAATVVRTDRESALRRLLRNRAGTVGMLICAVFALLAFGAPLIAPHDPLATDWGALRQPPSDTYWFGTDDIGRDVLSRVIWGSRASLLAGVVSVLIAMAAGVPAGLISGYAGGILDVLLMRVTDGLLAVPALILAIALAAFLGPSLGNAMIAIGVAAAPVFMRLTRGEVLALRHEQYVEAAHTMGFSDLRITVRHILPNVLPVLLVQATLSIATAIIAEAGLSFLGLGQQPPAPSWGASLNAARNFIVDAPWMSVWPGAFCAMCSIRAAPDGYFARLSPTGRTMSSTYGTKPCSFALAANNQTWWKIGMVGRSIR